MTTPQTAYRTRYDYLLAALCTHDSDDCLLWPFFIDRDGYGRLPYKENGKELKVAAHRLAFKTIHGRWPEPLGLHSCDNPTCFNPRHIHEGDHVKNQGEKAARDRSLCGTQQHDAKLNEDLVHKLRVEYANGKNSYQALANQYGVTKAAMRCAITGKTWRHVR